MDRKYSLDSLTGLKGLFIFVIVLFHTLPDTPFIDQIPLTSFISNYGGDLGNYMFFMLSGFLMSHGYYTRISNHEISFLGYLKKRLCKLYPIYILSNIVMLTVEMIHYGVSVINLNRIVMTALLQSGGGLDMLHPYNGPSWFVSALLVCYMVHYFILYAAKNTTQYACMIAAAIIWGYSIAIEGWVPPIAYGRCGAAFLNYFIGCALFGIFPMITQKHKKPILLLSLLTIMLSGILMIRYGVEIIGGDSRIAFAFVICPLILFISYEKNIFSDILKSKPIMYLGKISMSIFFWHFVIYTIYAFFYEKIYGSPIGDIAYAFYLILLVSVCSASQLLSKTKKM